MYRMRGEEGRQGRRTNNGESAGEEIKADRRRRGQRKI